MAIKRSIRKKSKKAVKHSTQLSAKRRAELAEKAKKLVFTMKTPLRAYRELEKRIDKTWKKLRNDVKTRSRRAILKGRRDLLLLLGECNYMARECGRAIQAKH